MSRLTIKEQNLAEENLTLFLHCFAKGHPALQTIALQIITDILITHPDLLSEPHVDTTATTDVPTGSNQNLEQVIKAFKKSLKSDDPAVQSTGATALSKAMLSRLITDRDLLKQLVIAYFDPDTNTNAHLRQSLSYFLPVYCHSRAENARRMAENTPAIISKLATLRESLALDADVDEEGGDGMVKLGVVGQMMLDWTDPRKIVGFAEAAGSTSAADGAGETHFVLAERVLERLNTSQVSKEEKKVLLSMLGKMHLPAGGCEPALLEQVLCGLQEAMDTNVGTDATSKNTLTKTRDQLLKQMNAFMTAERGGGGADETVLDPTEVSPETIVDSTELPDITEPPDTQVGAEQTEGTVMGSLDEDATVAEEVDDDATALQKTVRDTTIGVSTLGAVDAEGTRVVLLGGGEEDTEMMDVDDEEEEEEEDEEYTEV